MDLVLGEVIRRKKSENLREFLKFGQNLLLFRTEITFAIAYIFKQSK